MKPEIRCAAIGAMALLALAGCQGHGASTAISDKATPNVTLQLYTVPPDRTQSIRDTLISAAISGGANITVAAPGKLLVAAPADMQESVGGVIETLSKTTAPAAAPAQVVTHFWVIDGETGAGNDDPALKDLAGSLDSLKKAMGPMHFHLDQAASLVSNGNDKSKLTTSDDPARQRVYLLRVNAIDGGTAKLQLDYQDSFSSNGLREINTQIDATFGQYIVLAQAPGACPQPSTNTSTANCTDKLVMRLLVMRVDRLNTQD
ncbi:hypothetical protein [Rhodanobacter sp. DHB23]|uniref:hypothetical protein n=1 Tax=Rhodanobacter sp. DHB23 TaxID=2775923 RepID=UPI00177E93DD|nr:hypothetical protein [Rhodanobacter sp. DHB23]MBD8874148.1 hypothetical protein [Rhodanobacter sp. DHB23]